MNRQFLYILNIFLHVSGYSRKNPKISIFDELEFHYPDQIIKFEDLTIDMRTARNSVTALHLLINDFSPNEILRFQVSDSSVPQNPQILNLLMITKRRCSVTGPLKQSY